MCAEQSAFYTIILQGIYEHCLKGSSRKYTHRDCVEPAKGNIQIMTNSSWKLSGDIHLNDTTSVSAVVFYKHHTLYSYTKNCYSQMQVICTRLVQIQFLKVAAASYSHLVVSR